MRENMVGGRGASKVSLYLDAILVDHESANHVWVKVQVYSVIYLQVREY
jgi:hypothetical protein